MKPKFCTFSVFELIALLLLPLVQSVIAGTPSVPVPSPQEPARRVALRLHGSNTIGKELASAVCEDFLKSEGATSVQRKPGEKEDETDIEAILPNESAEPLIFEVQAHGTKTAFEDLAAGKCDIGMASRQITSEEAQQCASAGLGDMFSPACEKVLGLDGIAVFVNQSNPINALTKEQIAKIFSGEITDWSEVGGHPGAINLHSPMRNPARSTYSALLYSALRLFLPKPYVTRIVRNFPTKSRSTRTVSVSPEWLSCAAASRSQYRWLAPDPFCRRPLLSRPETIPFPDASFSIRRRTPKTNGVVSSWSLHFQVLEGVPS